MEFFSCPSKSTGNVFLDDSNQGSNKSPSGQLLVKQCEKGKHKIELRGDGLDYEPVNIVISKTDPIFPLEIPFP